MSFKYTRKFFKNHKKKFLKNNNKKKSKKNSKKKSKKISKKKYHTRKIKGGFINISNRLSNIKQNIKNKFINLLLRGQNPVIKDKIQYSIENDIKFKKVDKKIEEFLVRIDELIQKIVQTTITTVLKIFTAAFPGISVIGALITTVINWTTINIKFFQRGYDLYSVYSEMKNIIETQKEIKGGTINNSLYLQELKERKEINNLQQEIIGQIAGYTVREELHKVKNN